MLMELWHVDEQSSTGSVISVGDVLVKMVRLFNWNRNMRTLRCRAEVPFHRELFTLCFLFRTHTHTHAPYWTIDPKQYIWALRISGEFRFLFSLCMEYIARQNITCAALRHISREKMTIYPLILPWTELRMIASVDMLLKICRDN